MSLMPEPNQFLKVRGANEHNLQNVDIDIPKNKLIVMTGVSGSGKSSLAFDTIYAEGQRRYVESLSAYARQFLQMMQKPDVESIEGLSPAISIEQKSTNPMSMELTTSRPRRPRCGMASATTRPAISCGAWKWVIARFFITPMPSHQGLLA